MNFRIQSLALFICISILMSCSSSKEMTGSEQFEIKHWLTMQKFPCFGHCQVFKLSMYRNGLVILEGKEHLEKTGVHFAELNEEKTKKFQRLSDHQQWQKHKSEYIVNIADLPVTELEYFDKNGAKIKHIKANSNLPDPLHNLTKALNDLIKTEKWTQVQRKNDMINPEIITNELIIDMDSSLTKEGLENEFKLYDFKTVNQISTYMNLWSFQFDESKIGKYEMLIMLRKKKGIRSVNFNRKLLPRE